jgi:hypothetical protein
MKPCQSFIFSVLFASAFAFGQSTGTDANEWHSGVKSDPLTGKSYTLFTLNGKFLVPPSRANTDPPLISLRCDPSPDHGRILGKLVDGFIVVNAVIDIKNGDTPTVQYRLDDGKLQSAYDVSYSTDYQAMHINGLLLNNMIWGHNLFHKPGSSPQVRKFVIAVQEHLAGQVVMQFDMPDAKQVAAACGTETK